QLREARDAAAWLAAHRSRTKASEYRRRDERDWRRRRQRRTARRRRGHQQWQCRHRHRRAESLTTSLNRLNTPNRSIERQSSLRSQYFPLDLLPQRQWSLASLYAGGITVSL